MPYQALKKHILILGSKSPRRQEFLKDLGLDYQIRTSDIEEEYPSHLRREAITDYVAQLKANSIKLLNDKEILITSDTTVWNNNQSLGKPADRDDAFNMLKSLSNKKHEVITSICLTSMQKQVTVHCITAVYFNELTNEMINYYIDHYHPYDKAGSYGIQEWIGLVGIEKIEGSYTNIVGLPTTQLMQELIKFIQ